MPTQTRRETAAKTLVIDTTMGAAMFSQPRQRQALFAFVGHDRTLGEVSASISMPMNLLHYFVQRMLRAGLLRRGSKRTVAGRAVQLYRAIASSFYVPAELVRSRPNERLERELRQALERRGADGYLFTQDDAGRPRMRKVGGDEGAELWRAARLDEADARDLAARMNRLVTSFERRAGAGAKSYLLHLAVVRRG